jgi:hypothetical protein
MEPSSRNLHNAQSLVRRILPDVELLQKGMLAVSVHEAQVAPAVWRIAGTNIHIIVQRRVGVSIRKKPERRFRIGWNSPFRRTWLSFSLAGTVYLDNEPLERRTPEGECAFFIS